MNNIYNKEFFDWDAEEPFCNLNEDEIDQSQDSKLALKIASSCNQKSKVNPLNKKGSMKKEDQEKFMKEIKKLDLHSQREEYEFVRSPRPVKDVLRTRRLSKNTDSESPNKISNKSIRFTQEIRALLRELSEQKRIDFSFSQEENSQIASSECIQEKVVTMNDIEAAI
jgi:hypothetical protein